MKLGGFRVCGAPYVLRHVNGNGYIKRASMPPRTCEFTQSIDEAELFEIEREALYCADFITKFAFRVEVVKKDE